MSSFKVVHIASSYGGGAGRSAWRQHRSLLEYGTKSIFLSTDMTPPNECPETWRRLIPKKYNDKSWFKKLFTQKTEREITEGNIRRLKGAISAEAYCVPFSDFRAHEHDEIRSADIVNLHWVGWTLDYPSFFQGIQVPIVWTMHDMQPFLGLFHYRDDALKNKAICEELEKKIYEIKRVALESSSSSISLVCPSRWLFEQIDSASIFNRFPQTVIPYSLDLQTFSLRNKAASREKLGLAPDRKYILFISKNLYTERKGGTILHEALNRLHAAYPDWELIAIGETGRKWPEADYQIHLPGPCSNDNTLCNWYAAADLVAIPSLEDNLPNVMLEALACGKPVICLSNSGMREHLQDDQTGWVANDRNDFESTLQKVLSNWKEPDNDYIRNYALSHFTNPKQARAYNRLYQEIISH